MIDTLTPLRQALLVTLGRLYLFTYWSTLRRVAGIPVSRLIKGAPLLLALVGLLLGWPLPFLVFLTAVALLIQLAYLFARRRSYKSFVANPLPPIAPVTLLPPNQRVKLLATGTFSLNDREATVLLAPAEYWHVPLGEHIVMVEQVPGYYLYQFFNGETVKKVVRGWLIFGNAPKPSLAVTFALSWGPEYADYGKLYFVPNEQKEPPPRYRTVYFSLADGGDLTAVYHTILANNQ